MSNISMWLYTCKQPKNRLFKNTLYDPNANILDYWYVHFGLSGNFVGDTSLTDPVLEVKLYKGMRVYDGNKSTYHDNVNFSEIIERANKINYINLPDFVVYDATPNTERLIGSRYYFVNEIEFCEHDKTGSGATEEEFIVLRLHCHIDVLMTYRYNIKHSNSALIVAQEHASGGDLLYDLHSLSTNIPEVEIVDSDNTIAFNGVSIVLLTVGNPDAAV